MSIGSIVASILAEPTDYTPPPMAPAPAPVEAPSSILEIEGALLNVTLAPSNQPDEQKTCTIEELVLAHLNFSEEHHPTYFRAEPQQATVDALCQRTQDASARHLKNIVTLRQKFDSSLHIAPKTEPSTFLSPYGGIPSYQFMDVCLSTKTAVAACEAPYDLKISGVNWTDNQFYWFFAKHSQQFARVGMLTISFCPNLRHLTVELPELLRLQLFGQLESVVVKNCPRLVRVDVFQNDSSYDIDLSETNCRQVKTFDRPVNLISKDGPKKELRENTDPFTRALRCQRREKKEEHKKEERKEQVVSKKG